MQHRDQHDRRHDAALPRLHHRGSGRRTRPSRRSRTCSGSGGFPNADELARFQRELDDAMALPPESFGWFHGLPTDVHPMDFLHAVVAGLSLHDPDANVLSVRGEPAQGGAPDRAPRDDRRRLRPRAERPMAAAAAAGPLARVELPLHAARQGAVGAARPPVRHLPDPARGPRAERVGVLGARHLEHALGHVLERDGGDRHAEGRAARRRQRAGDAHAARDRLAEAARGLSRRRARRQAQGDGLRPPRLQGRRPARGDPEAHERRAHRRDRPARALRDERRDRGATCTTARG